MDNFFSMAYVEMPAEIIVANYLLALVMPPLEHFPLAKKSTLGLSDLEFDNICRLS